MKVSLRFKLTLFYSLIFTLSTSVFLTVATAVVQQQYNRSPEEIVAQLHDDDDFMPRSPQQMHALIEKVRQEDLAKIQTTGALAFIGLMGLSVVAGYIVAGRMLQPLYDSLQAQRQFIENASHELKTPLTIAQTNLEAMLHDTQMSQADRHTAIERAVSATSFMNQLIEDLLLLAVTKEQLVKHSINLDELIHLVVTQLEPVSKTHGKNLQYQTTIQAHQVTVQGSSALLQRAVMNCIENAIKYAEHSITVTTALEHGRSIITVSDDGCGIPAHELEKVTERFYRVDNSRSRASGGSGLGLAITKMIVELHGGQLRLSSTPQQGTTVTIVL